MILMTGGGERMILPLIFTNEILKRMLVSDESDDDEYGWMTMSDFHTKL